MFIYTKYSMVFFSFTEGNFAIIQSVKSIKVKILNSLRRTHTYILKLLCTGIGVQVWVLLSRMLGTWCFWGSGAFP